MRQLPYDALAVAYVNATKDEPRLMRSQKEEKIKTNQRKIKKREKSLFDPGRHFPVPYLKPAENPLRGSALGSRPTDRTDVDTRGNAMNGV